METLLHDFRLAFRSLIRSPGFALVAIVTLALGIGANTAIYSIVQHVLFRPFPFLASERLVALWEVAPGGNDHNEFTPGAYREVRATARTVDRVVAHAWATANLTGGDRPERVQAFRVSADFFDALGVRPMLGRGFRPGEDEFGNDKVVILTHGLWTRRFGADSGVVGRSIAVNGVARQVVGVLGPGVRYPAPAELYVPLAMSPEGWASRRGHYLLVTARLAPGATVGQARDEVLGIASRMAREYPATNERWSANARQLIPDVTRQLQPVVLVLLLAVGFVLLIACANTANLLLARGAGRQQELFVCAALGAGRWRLARRVLVESVVLAVFGGAVGIAVGVWGLDAIVALVPAQHARFLGGLDRVSVDVPVLAFTTVLTLATALLFGVLPAWRAARASDIEGALRSGGRQVVGGRHRARSTLVALEVGLALVLLVGAGLMVRTFGYLANRDTGLDVRNVALTTIALPAQKYGNRVATQAFWRELIERTEALPGVSAVGVASIIPMCQCNQTTSFNIEGEPRFAAGQEPDVGERIVSPRFLDVLGVRMLRGRAFTAADADSAPRVVIVNAALERRYFPGGALGHRLLFGDTIPFAIIGVVADVRHGGPAAEPAPEVFRAQAQSQEREATLAVRLSRGDPLAMLAPMRGIVTAMDAELPVFDQTTMEGVAALAVGPLRLAMWVMGMLAALALALASIGIYGVVAQLVAERSREIGVRMALGGDRGSVVALVLRRGLTAVLAGVGGGLVASALLTTLARKALVGISPVDPLTFGSVTALLVVAAVIACVAPARRAARVDPMVALRSE
jgi:putative ABC transport system permease protein